MISEATPGPGDGRESISPRGEIGARRGASKFRRPAIFDLPRLRVLAGADARGERRVEVGADIGGALWVEKERKTGHHD